MKSRKLALLSAMAVLVAACSSGGTSPSATAGSESAAATRVEVSLTDALRIEPSSMTVQVGVPVTFVVTNTGSVEHEFYLGDEEAQTEFEAEMQAGAMRHDQPEGISVAPGETKELAYTFTEPGETLAGCHVLGHYGGGMKATITIA
jgi:uncharacterized cupredoxin-like copper-binding protein